MAPKCILFDLDGTLTDSGKGIINCGIYTLQYFGLPVPDREELRSMVGPPLRQTFAKYGIPDEQLDEAIRIYREHYVPTGMFENDPYPGICELLSKLRTEGFRLFVATSKPEHMAKQILAHFQMDHYFELICGAESDRKRETKSAVIAYLLDLIGGAENAVMVGDTAFDVLGAKEHGIPTVGVSWGYGEEADMRTAGAAAIVHTMDELYQQLHRDPL